MKNIQLFASDGGGQGSLGFIGRPTCIGYKHFGQISLAFCSFRVSH